jgi:hypothetical protein
MLDEVDKRRLKENYTSWTEINDRKKELATETKALLEDTAVILDTKAAKVGKLFKVIEKKLEDGVDEIDEMQELLVQFEN